MTGVFIFTRDRPMQLDACLRSLAENAPQLAPATVLVRWTNDDYENGYRTLTAEHADCQYVFETDFARDVHEILPTLAAHTLFLCDDSITYRPLPVDPDDVFTDDVISFSLRLGRNIRYCHPRDLHHGLPKSLEERGPFLVWDWAEAPEGDVFAWKGLEGDFGYPYSLDGIVHRAGQIADYLNGANFVNPNRMEGCVLAALRRDGLPPKLASYHESVQVGLPINQVNTEVKNRVGLDHPTPIDDLNDRYLDGERIDYDAMDFTDIFGPFQEMPLIFK